MLYPGILEIPATEAILNAALDAGIIISTPRLTTA
jgi:hypothetical protein